VGQNDTQHLEAAERAHLSMPTISFSQSHYYAVQDARSAPALAHLANIAGDVGRLVRELADYNAHKRDDFKTDALHIIILGQLGTVDDLPIYGAPPAAWDELYQPYRAALLELEAIDETFLTLWRRVIGRLLPADEDDQEARRLVAAIEAQRDAVSHAKVGALQRLRVQLLPEALSSWLQCKEHGETKRPAIKAARAVAEEAAQRARTADESNERMIDSARQQMQAIGRAMLALPEHSDKHEQLKKLLPAPAPVGKVLYPRPIADHVQPYAAPEDAPPVEHAPSPWG
jgi:hypothetical protein